MGYFSDQKLLQDNFSDQIVTQLDIIFSLAVIFKIEILLSKHVSALKTLYFRPLKEFLFDLEIFALFSYRYIQHSELPINPELGCVFTFFILVMGEFGNLLHNLRSIGGSKGGRQGRPRGPNTFIFMQFSAKKRKIIALLGVGAPPSGKSWIRHCDVKSCPWKVPSTNQCLMILVDGEAEDELTNQH